jgi:hypothetical protein
VRAGRRKKQKQFQKTARICHRRRFGDAPNELIQASIIAVRRHSSAFSSKLIAVAIAQRKFEGSSLVRKPNAEASR